MPKSEPPAPLNLTLLGGSVFADVIKFSILRDKPSMQTSAPIRERFEIKAID